MKNILLPILFFLATLNTVEGFAQKADSIHFRKNAVYAELLGSGWGYSINYERKIFVIGDDDFITLRAGVSAYDADQFRFPLLINVVDGGGNHHFEFGVGATLPFQKKWPTNKYYLDKHTSEFAATMNLMYRYQKPKGHFIARIGWTPLFVLDHSYYTWSEGVIVILGFLNCGVSIGYSF